MKATFNPAMQRVESVYLAQEADLLDFGEAKTPVLAPSHSETVY